MSALEAGLDLDDLDGRVRLRKSMVGSCRLGYGLLGDERQVN
jgi:hypothetical protein